MTSAADRRGAYFRTNLRSRSTFWALFLSAGGSLVAAAALHDWRILAAGPALVTALVVLSAWHRAAKRAEGEFFEELAPQLALAYTMQGPLFGRMGGPPCRLGEQAEQDAHFSAAGQTIL